jgi:murein L,D-transpeptidase YafK
MLGAVLEEPTKQEDRPMATEPILAPKLNRRRVLAGIGLGSAAWSALPRTASAEAAASILVEKAGRRLTLLRADGQVLASFRAALGHAWGPKEVEGDGKTPEGLYHVESFNPRSAFYRALKISYPNEQDRQRAAERGRRPGGLIMIHGLDPSIEAKWRDEHWMFNWTRGCIAVTNEQMDQIWSRVRLGTPIEIRA